MSKDYGMGADEGQVQHESYCMKRSVEAENNREMNALMGYHDMGDLANTPKYPTQMGKERRNTQLMNGVPGRYKHP